MKTLYVHGRAQYIYDLHIDVLLCKTVKYRSLVLFGTFDLRIDVAIWRFWSL